MSSNESLRRLSSFFCPVFCLPSCLKHYQYTYRVVVRLLVHRLIGKAGHWRQNQSAYSIAAVHCLVFPLPVRNRWVPYILWRVRVSWAYVRYKVLANILVRPISILLLHVHNVPVPNSLDWSICRRLPLTPSATATATRTVFILVLILRRIG